LPKAQEDRESDKVTVDKARDAITEILRYDPDRLNIVGSDTGSKFTYAEAIDRAANVCRIPSANYTYNASSVVKSGDKEIQAAHVSLDDVAIVQVARFLSMLQSTWVNLSCEKVTLKKKEGMPDQWGVDMDFKYTY
jgi:hypothetical protein